jgi:hypothetical protein
MADHDGVRQQEERLGDEGSERGDGEAQDVAIHGAGSENTDA